MTNEEGPASAPLTFPRELRAEFEFAWILFSSWAVGFERKGVIICCESVRNERMGEEDAKTTGGWRNKVGRLGYAMSKRVVQEQMQYYHIYGV